jgi:hypothetical protein
MKKLLLVPIAAGLFLTGCGDNTSKTSPATNAPAKYDTGNPLTAPADYLGVVVQAENHSKKVIDVSYLNQAIQLFNASEGRYPKTLDELVPNYVGKLPETPFGTKLDYDATAGTVKVVPN